MLNNFKEIYMLDSLKARLKEIEGTIVNAYANLNLYNGMKHEVERLIAEILSKESDELKTASESQANSSVDNPSE